MFKGMQITTPNHTPLKINILEPQKVMELQSIQVVDFPDFQAGWIF